MSTAVSTYVPSPFRTKFSNPPSAAKLSWMNLPQASAIPPHPLSRSSSADFAISLPHSVTSCWIGSSTAPSESVTFTPSETPFAT